MKKKILSLFIFLSLLLSPTLKSGVLDIEEFKTHKRINLFTSKEQLVISVNNKTVAIETLDFKLYEEIIQQIKDNVPLGLVVKEISTDTSGHPQHGVKILIKLHDNIEAFKFYKDIEKKYVIDLWSSADSKEKMVAIVNKNDLNKTDLKKKSPSLKSKVDKPQETPLVTETEDKIQKKIKNGIDESILVRNGFRDFRYGAPFIVNYPPMLPISEQTIDVRNKTADFLYKIEDRKYSESEEEAHIQLTINLFRERKFGLMNKSIELYEEKYGEEKNQDLFDFMKASGVLKDAIVKNEIEKQVGPHKMAYGIYEEVAERTSDYLLKRAIYHYLIEQKIKMDGLIEALSIAKKLYVESRENFDKEEEKFSLEKILYVLATLSQTDNIENLLKEKNVDSVLAKQVQKAYLVYSMMKNKKFEEVVRIFEDKKDVIAKPIEPSFLFNVAESYFQIGDFEKSIKLFDEFVSTYSEKHEASYARLRIALSYDFLGEDAPKIAALYKETINKSGIAAVGFEARIRYVATILNRKIEVNKEDDIYLEYLNRRDSEEKVLDNDEMKRLMWLVRLRSFINRREYQQALLYLNSLPITSMTRLVQNVFYADASEIIHGLIKEGYQQGDYGKVVKLWQKHRAEYFDKMPLNLSVNFMVCYSYLQLGLYNSANEIILNLEKNRAPFKNFPNWIDGIFVKDTGLLIAEINLLRELKEKNWERALSLLVKIEKDFSGFEKTNFYLAKVYYQLDDFEKTIEASENFLLKSQNNHLPLSHKEINEFFISYLEAIYKKDQYEKFEKSAVAVLDDIKRTKEMTDFIKELKERVIYLLVEVLDKKENKNSIYKIKLEEFVQEFPQSIYLGRVKFLLGKFYLSEKNDKEGERILTEVVSDERIPSYIKELAKSELSTLKIERQSI